jgi:hypothetical protein
MPIMIMMRITTIKIMLKVVDTTERSSISVLTFQNVVSFGATTAGRSSLFGITPTESLLKAFAERHHGALSIDSRW